MSRDSAHNINPKTDKEIEERVTQTLYRLLSKLTPNHVQENQTQLQQPSQKILISDDENSK